MIGELLQREALPVPYGIYHGSNVYRAIRGDLPDIVVSEPLQLPPTFLVERGEASISSSFHLTEGDYAIHGGGTSWEGDGYLALERCGALVWLVHLPQSEEFVSAEFTADDVVAKSFTYPRGFRVEIPITDPHKLRIEAMA